MAKIRITEYLNIDIEKETWCCDKCGKDLMEARDNYKKGCLVCERDPSEIYESVMDGDVNLTSPNSDICMIIEFYCPNCLTMIENEYLPPGHPITFDIELDIDSLKERFRKGEIWEGAIKQ